MKNTIYIVVIVACLLVAAIVFVKTRSGGSSAGIDSISAAEKIWVMCTNSSCGTSYEMGKKDFYVQIEDKAKSSTTGILATPLLTCTKCGKDSIVKAVKCDQCGNVFRENSVPADWYDRCPKCKYSKEEAKRKARLSGSAQPQ